jgi:hypothetical protein
MTDVTRLLENSVEATTIVQKFDLLLVKHVLWKKKKKNEKKSEKKEKLMRPLYIETVTSLDKCTVTFYWVT